MQTKGQIVSINISGTGGIPKNPIPMAHVGMWGLVGDYHNRQMRRSFSKPGTFKPNTDRHLTLLAQEVLTDLNRELLLSLKGGSLGENITTKGLGDLSKIPDGSRLRIGTQVVLRVTEQNQPCMNLYPVHRLLVKRIYGRRGLLCTIEEGVDESIFVGDKIQLIT